MLRLYNYTNLLTESVCAINVNRKNSDEDGLEDTLDGNDSDEAKLDQKLNDLAGEM
jgi:hypothetical protein